MTGITEALKAISQPPTGREYRAFIEAPFWQDVPHDFNCDAPEDHPLRSAPVRPLINKPGTARNVGVFYVIAATALILATLIGLGVDVLASFITPF